MLTITNFPKLDQQQFWWLPKKYLIDFLDELGHLSIFKVSCFVFKIGIGPALMENSPLPLLTLSLVVVFDVNFKDFLMFNFVGWGCVTTNCLNLIIAQRIPGLIGGVLKVKGTQPYD